MKKISIRRRKNGQVVKEDVQFTNELNVFQINNLHIHVYLLNEYENLIGSGIRVDLTIEEYEPKPIITDHIKLINKINRIKKIMNNGIKLTNLRHNRKENEGLLKKSCLNSSRISNVISMC